MDETSAEEVIRWRYEPPYDIYNVSEERFDETLGYILDPHYDYYCILNDEGVLEAYCCFGKDAQVGGGDYSLDALDVGLGVRPDLTGQGRGYLYVSSVIEFAHRQYEPSALRATVVGFNKRAQRVWQKAGFEQVESFDRFLDGRTFVVMMRRGMQRGGL